MRPGSPPSVLVETQHRHPRDQSPAKATPYSRPETTTQHRPEFPRYVARRVELVQLVLRLQLCTLASEKSVIGIIRPCYHLHHAATSTCKAELCKSLVVFLSRLIPTMFNRTSPLCKTRALDLARYILTTFCEDCFVVFGKSSIFFGQLYDREYNSGRSKARLIVRRELSSSRAAFRFESSPSSTSSRTDRTRSKFAASIR